MVWTQKNGKGVGGGGSPQNDDFVYSSVVIALLSKWEVMSVSVVLSNKYFC